jgi:hypothetical protein
VTNYVANIARYKKCRELGSHSPAASTYSVMSSHDFGVICCNTVAGDVTDDIGHCKVEIQDGSNGLHGCLYADSPLTAILSMWIWPI